MPINRNSIYLVNEKAGMFRIAQTRGSAEGGAGPFPRLPAPVSRTGLPGGRPVREAGAARPGPSASKGITSPNAVITSTITRGTGLLR
ncbi:hypothetical protein Pve01_19790 [Planomonospora venezuelensis]|nr:hypothetical protein Pve01_19790 [Planomonospora venezuelensis]